MNGEPISTDGTQEADDTIEAGKAFLERFSQDQVIIVSFSKATGLIRVTSAGLSTDDAMEAARGADFVKRSLGFPQDMLGAVPARGIAAKRLLCEKCDAAAVAKFLDVLDTKAP